MQFLDFYLPKIRTMVTVTGYTAATQNFRTLPFWIFHKPKIVETCRNSARINSSNIDFQAIIFAKIYS